MAAFIFGVLFMALAFCVSEALYVLAGSPLEVEEDNYGKE